MEWDSTNAAYGFRAVLAVDAVRQMQDPRYIAKSAEVERARLLLAASRDARNNRKYSHALSLIREGLSIQPEIRLGAVELSATLLLNDQNAEADVLMQKLATQATDDSIAFGALQGVYEIVELAASKVDSEANQKAARRGATERAWKDHIRYRLKWDSDVPGLAIAPFDAEQARQHQEQWAKYLGIPVEYTNSIGMKLRLIPPGEFNMGMSRSDYEAAAAHFDPKDIWWQVTVKSAVPQHRVVTTRAIYVAVHEVTQEQYARVTGQTPSHFSSSIPRKNGASPMNSARHPVEMVNWNDAVAFCVKLSELERSEPLPPGDGSTGSRSKGGGYRVPTEAEWEFACRAGTTSAQWFVNQNPGLTETGWTLENSAGQTHEVGLLHANPFGLHDIYGNVWEWVEDWWQGDSYRQYEGQLAVNPRGPSKGLTDRVARGGCYSMRGADSTLRGRAAPNARESFIGFRIVMPVEVVGSTNSSKIPKNP